MVITLGGIPLELDNISMIDPFDNRSIGIYSIKYILISNLSPVEPNKTFQFAWKGNIFPLKQGSNGRLYLQINNSENVNIFNTMTNPRFNGFVSNEWWH